MAVSFLSWGTTPHRTDTINTLLKRIAGADSSGGGGGGGSGTGESGIVGVVDPEGVVTATPGTTYYNSADATFWVKHTGSGNTGWQQIA